MIPDASAGLLRMTQTNADVDVRSVSVPGATVVYDVRGDLQPETTPLVLIGSPMDAVGFGTLASHFPDRVVVTYDPRNTGRSTCDEPTAEVTAVQHADDLHAVLEALGTGPVDLFGSSGGALNGLVLVARHPDDVRLFVAHEPPLTMAVADADAVAAVVDDMYATFQAQGSGQAMAKFITFVTHRGEVPQDYLNQPPPDPAAFGMSGDDDGNRADALMNNLRGGCNYDLDFEAVKASPTRVIPAAGEESGGPTEGEFACRATYGVAAALGEDVVVFPDGHGGFLGGEYGQMGKPDDFAARLREVLAG